MKTLFDYLKDNIERTEPYSIIDHRLRAQLHADGRISFYIHADSVDSETIDFWVEDNELTVKRLQDEPLSDELAEKIRKVILKFGGFRGFGNPNYFCVPDDMGTDFKTVVAAIESCGVTSNYQGFDDENWIFKPHLG